MKKILGISAYYHDSAAALVCDGRIVAAAQQERFSRIKHDPSFPTQAIEYCLEEGGFSLSDVDAVVFYDKPLLKFERLLETYLAHAPFGFRSFLRAMPVWLKEKLYLKQVLRRELRSMLAQDQQSTKLPQLLFTEHHQSHAASAYYPSPFDDAAVICLDGVGEWTTSSVWHGQGSQLTALYEVHFPHSLGLLYSAFTYYCGFKVNSGEYKLMGLAPYGQPKYVDLIYQHLIDVKDDGSFALDLKYFDYATGERMTNHHFHALFGGEPYEFDQTPDRRCMDLARSIQVVIEEVVIKIARFAQQQTGCNKLCLAGGVALNCVANGKLRESGLFDDIWIQPAAGDAGGALGAALQVYYAEHPEVAKPNMDTMQGAYLGPQYSDDAINIALNEWQVTAHQMDDDALNITIAQQLADENVVGWFQGRMEYGPRALGNRSILGDPRSSSMQSVMNVKIKQRESFRPFAPAVLEDKASDYFMLNGTRSPYMLQVASVHPNYTFAVDDVPGLEQLKQTRSSLPAITHVDYTARVQTVSGKTNPKFARLIEQFATLTDLPMLINTSFNVRGEPPVCTPSDAIRGFLATDMDTLVMNNYVLFKSEQPVEACEKAAKITFVKD